ncbi:MAG: glycosyltransferase [Actinobacteria bacterium]|nr:glycosyltransferase [Actinomycetota bacterium]
MRVVDVTQWYAPRSGGIRTYLHAKAAYAAETRRAHALIVPGTATKISRVERSPIIEVPGLPTAQETGYRLIPHPRPILRALERLEPSVLVVHDATAFPRSLCRWARTRGIPVVMLVHSELEAGAAGIPTPLRLPTQHVLRLVQARGMEGPDAVIATSNSVAERLRSRSGIHIYVSPLGVDTGIFYPREPDENLRRALAQPNETLLIHAGRLSSEKRPELLIDVITELRDSCVLAIAGSGSAEDDLRRRVAAQGLEDRVRFLGHIDDREQLARLYAVADCFVHVNSGETFGLAPLEALACGCRVVLPSDCGVAEAAGTDDLITVEPNSVAALVDGIRNAVSHPRPMPEVDQLSWWRTFEREWALYGLLAGRAAVSEAVA